MTIQPSGTVPSYIDPTTLNTGGIAPAAGATSPGVYGDQIDLNFEYQRWSKGASRLHPTYGEFTTATNPVTWTMLDSVSDDQASDSDGYFDPLFPNKLTVPTGRGGYYLAFALCEIGDTQVSNPTTINSDSYELRALVNSTTVYKMGQFVQGPAVSSAGESWPVGNGCCLILLAAADVVQFQITSATAEASGASFTKFTGNAKFGLRLLGTT